MARIPIKPRLPILDKLHPLTRGLVFDVPLFEGSGSVAREFLRKYKGTIVNPTWSTSHMGKVLNFNGAGRGVTFTNIPALQAFNYLSVEFYLYRLGAGGDGYGTVFDFGDSTTERSWLNMQNDNYDGGWGMRINTFYTNREKVWSVDYPSNNIWHHYVISYDHTNKDNVPLVYKNAVKIAVTNRFDASWTQTINSNDLSIGRSFETGGDEYFGGYIAYFRLWKRILRPDEVAQLYVNPWCIYKKPPIYLGKASAVIPPSNLADNFFMFFD